jgi:hypothetical protein
MFRYWNNISSRSVDFTEEELVMSVICSGLGNVGDMINGIPRYVPNDSDWHVTRGIIYKINENLTHMDVANRSILNLVKYGISLTENEYTAVLYHDGMYLEANKYFYTQNTNTKHSSNLPVFLHHVDHMTSIFEKNTPEDNGLKTSPTNKVTKLAKLNNTELDRGLASTIANMQI